MVSASDHFPKRVFFSGAAMAVDATSHDDANATRRASEGVEDGIQSGHRAHHAALPVRGSGRPTQALGGRRASRGRGRGREGRGREGRLQGGRELIPRLARTYRGHSGYVHSVAVLGALSDPIGTDDHYGPGDHGGRRGKRDDVLTQSDHGPGLRGAFKRRTGRLSRSLTQDEASYISGELREGGSRSTELSRSTTSYTPSAVGRRMSQLSLDSSGGGGMGTKLLFVSASRDNTLQIWPIDDGDERRQGVSFSDDPGGSREGGGSMDNTRIKLWEHQFG